MTFPLTHILPGVQTIIHHICIQIPVVFVVVMPVWHKPVFLTTMGSATLWHRQLLRLWLNEDLCRHYVWMSSVKHIVLSNRGTNSVWQTVTGRVVRLAMENYLGEEASLQLHNSLNYYMHSTTVLLTSSIPCVRVRLHAMVNVIDDQWRPLPTTLPWHWVFCAPTTSSASSCRSLNTMPSWPPAAYISIRQLSKSSDIHHGVTPMILPILHQCRGPPGWRRTQVVL